MLVLVRLVVLELAVVVVVFVESEGGTAAVGCASAGLAVDPGPDRRYWMEEDAEEEKRSSSATTLCKQAQ